MMENHPSRTSHDARKQQDADLRKANGGDNWPGRDWTSITS